ncbi:MAG: hypothetical protein ING10_18230 [Roseomonas sp.]|nr:hypothetical protein [Roseomonas sp.]
MLNGTAPVMKAAPQGAVPALGSGREVASRNQERTAYPSGKYDFFGSAQHSFGRWLKRGLRGNFVVLMMLILPACATISEEDNVLFQEMYHLVWSTPFSSTAPLVPERIRRCSNALDDKKNDYINFSECSITTFELYLPYAMTQRLSRTRQLAEPENYRMWGGGLDGGGDAMAKFTRFQQLTNAICPRFVPVPGSIECVRPFRTSLRDLRGCMFCFSQPTGPCRQGMIRFSIDIPNAQDLHVKQVRFDSIQPCS